MQITGFALDAAYVQHPLVCGLRIIGIGLFGEAGFDGDPHSEFLRQRLDSLDAPRTVGRIDVAGAERP